MSNSWKGREDGEFGLDRGAVRRSFHAAAGTYDQAAVLQAEVRSRLLERLRLVRIEPRVILDLGAGTGHASLELKKMYPRAHVVAMDLAPGMLQQARRRQRLWRRFDRLCADAARLPLREGSVDLVFSNLMLQWCDPPDGVFAEVRRVLTPNGLFSFTTFGPDTLRELRAAWAATDTHVHVNRFADMHDLGDGLVRARLAEPVMDMEYITLTYGDALSLMRELKAIGAHNVARGRRSGLTGKRALARMTEAYEQFRQNGRLPATYEVVFGHAWAPVGRAPAGRKGEVAVPISLIGRKR